jgi:hypothetical protein
VIRGLRGLKGPEIGCRHQNIIFEVRIPLPIVLDVLFVLLTIHAIRESFTEPRNAQHDFGGGFEGGENREGFDVFNALFEEGIHAFFQLRQTISKSNQYHRPRKQNLLVLNKLHQYRANVSDESWDAKPSRCLIWHLIPWRVGGEEDACNPLRFCSTNLPCAFVVVREANAVVPPLEFVFCRVTK